MAGRGRGRGRGLSFNIEALGIGRGDALPTPIQQPPQLYPPLLYKPTPLQQSETMNYLLAVKEEFRGAMRRSPHYLTIVEKKRDIERYSDRYQLSHQEAQGKWTPDWSRFPAELKERKAKRVRAGRPNLSAAKKKVKQEDVLKVIESLEKTVGEEEEKDEDDKEEGEKKEGQEEEEEEEYEEEELEEETDYNLTYFDNGEDYGDDDEDDDEGPIY